MKYLLLLLCVASFGCVNAQVKKEYDARNYSAQDKVDMQKYAEQYNKLVTTGSTNLMTGVNSGRHNGPETVQKFFCACYKKIGPSCAKNSEGVSESDREIWAKGNAANITLKSLGYEHLTDKDLCQ